jgi:hypothetical protein
MQLLTAGELRLKRFDYQILDPRWTVPVRLAAVSACCTAIGIPSILLHARDLAGSGPIGIGRRRTSPQLTSPLPTDGSGVGSFAVGRVAGAAG